MQTRVRGGGRGWRARAREGGGRPAKEDDERRRMNGKIWKTCERGEGKGIECDVARAQSHSKCDARDG